MRGGLTGCLLIFAASACNSAPPASCEGGCWKPTAAEESFITSFCALVDPCCTDLAGGVSLCTENLRQAGVTSDETVQAACIAELTSLSQSGTCAPEGWDLSDPCVRAINEPSGPQAPGSPCTSGADCAGAPGTVTMCGFAPPASTSCVQATRGGIGDGPCVGDKLADGSTHLYPLGNAVTPLISLGVICEERAGLYCDQTTDPTAPTCVAVLSEGSPCLSTAVCAAGSCLGYYPSGSSGICPTTVAKGASCAAANLVCAAGSWCDRANTGLCVATGDSGADCSADFECTGGYCPKQIASVCTYTIAEVNFLRGICGDTF